MSLYIDEKERDRILASPENLAGEVRNLHNGGRSEGDNNIPPAMRTLIGTMAHLDTAKNVAGAFGVSPSQVHQLKHGRTTSANGKNEQLDKSVKKNLSEVNDAIRDTALDKAMKAMSIIDEDSLLCLHDKPDKLARVASEMANVAEKVTKKEGQNAGSGLKIVVMTVNQASPTDYTEVTAIETDDSRS